MTNARSHTTTSMSPQVATLVIFAIALLPFVILWVLSALLSQPLLAGPWVQQAFIPALLSYLCAAALTLLAIAAFGRHTGVRLGPDLRTTKLHLGMVSFVAVTVAVVGVSVLMQDSGELHPVSNPQNSVSNLILFAIFCWVMQSIPFELAWRGYLMHIISDAWIALQVSANLFGLSYLIAGDPQSHDFIERVVNAQVTGGIGLLGAMLFVLTRSLWPPLGLIGGLWLGRFICGILGHQGGIALWGVQLLVTLVACGVLWAANRKRFPKMPPMGRTKNPQVPLG